MYLTYDDSPTKSFMTVSKKPRLLPDIVIAQKTHFHVFLPRKWMELKLDRGIVWGQSDHIEFSSRSLQGSQRKGLKTKIF